MSTHYPRCLIWLCAAWTLRAASAGEPREAGPPPALLLPPVQRAVEREDWPAVLKGLTTDPLTNSIVRLLVVRALFETGRLPEEQFAWFHAPGPELLATSELQQYMGASILADHLLQLGHLNAAERLAFDSLEFEGASPAVFRTLARLHAVKGLTNAAAVFLNRLQAYPEYAAWAVRFRAGPATNLAVDVDLAMPRIRANRVTRDRIAAGLTTERLLRLALEANPENRMAGEFLLAQQLLSRELLQARQTLATSPQGREGPLPRAYAEAVLLHRQVYPRVSLGNLLPRVPPAVASSISGRPIHRRASAAPAIPERMVDLHSFPPPGARDQTPQTRMERTGRLRRMVGPFASLLLAGLSMNLGPAGRGSCRAAVPSTMNRLGGSLALPDSWSLGTPARPRSLPTQTSLAVAPTEPHEVSVVTPGASAAPRRPRITPDYLEVVIPPNLAPLNLTIQEAGLDYRLHLSGVRGQPLELQQSHPHVRFPQREWKALLDANRGGALRWGISVRGRTGAWIAFTPFETRVAEEEIDPYLVYRRLRPLYSSYRHLGIYQRCLETFEEEPVLRNEAIGHGCVNCHTFLQGSPDRFALSLRGRSGTPTLLVTSNRLERIDVKLGYLAWHPNGRLLAFSANAITQFFHLAGPINREVYDPRSDLAILHVGDQREEKPPAIARPDRNENWPSWAPDGRHLYYCSAPVVADQDVPKVRYDLLRIAYDPDQNQWGEPETLVAAAEFQLSAHQPRVSPDNRSLVFTASDYGSFPLFRPESDLFLLRLDTRETERLAINSDQAETWHGWSSNGRWLIFVSRGLDGVFARVLISHVDPGTRFSKPLLLPQEDPTYYDTCLDNFNAPELVRGRIRISEDELARAYNTGGDRTAPPGPTPASPNRGADRPPVSDNPYPSVP